MKNTIKSIASHAYQAGARGLFLIFFLGLPGCAFSPMSARPAVFDFGPAPVVGSGTAPAPLAPLVIGEVEASPALDSTAVLYRLAYRNAQQLQPYAFARWSMTPTQLLRQRLREHLGAQRTLLNPGDSLVATPSGASPKALRLELEEFCHWFESPDQSEGRLRLRVTLTQASPRGEQVLAQHNFSVQRPATTADAVGGVRALTLASDALMLEIEGWLAGLATYQRPALGER